jgi:hypothetical protein
MKTYGPLLLSFVDPKPIDFGWQQIHREWPVSAIEQSLPDCLHVIGSITPSATARLSIQEVILCWGSTPSRLSTKSRPANGAIYDIKP